MVLIIVGGFYWFAAEGTEKLNDSFQGKFIAKLYLATCSMSDSFSIDDLGTNLVQQSPDSNKLLLEHARKPGVLSCSI